jgi:hypothetical protein
MKIKDKKVVDLKRKLRMAGIIGLALDIDDTLSATRESFFEEISKKIDNPEGLTGKELAEKYKHTDNVPYWPNEKIVNFTEIINNMSEFQDNLPLIENANKIVQEINKIIPIVAYITVRSESLNDGTKKWLRKHNFPEATLIARPENVARIMGNEWKAKVLEYLYPQVVGIVDDNPGLTKYFGKKYKGIVYLYDNVEAEREDINVIPCKDWETVVRKIKQCRL